MKSNHHLCSLLNMVPIILQGRANGWRYPLVGGTRQRHFDGTNFKPRKLLENAQTPTSRVHAVLARFSSGANSLLLLFAFQMFDSF